MNNLEKILYNFDDLDKMINQNIIDKAGIKDKHFELLDSLQGFVKSYLKESAFFSKNSWRIGVFNMGCISLFTLLRFKDKKQFYPEWDRFINHTTEYDCFADLFESHACFKHLDTLDLADDVVIDFCGKLKDKVGVYINFYNVSDVFPFLIDNKIKLDNPDFVKALIDKYKDCVRMGELYLNSETNKEV